MIAIPEVGDKVIYSETGEVGHVSAQPSQYRKNATQIKWEDDPGGSCETTSHLSWDSGRRAWIL